MMICPTCGKEISKEAYSCPSCGHPFKNDNPIQVPTEITLKKEGYGCLEVIGCLSVIFIVFLIYIFFF